MNECTIEEALLAIFRGYGDGAELSEETIEATTYDAGGYLTSDRGLVIRTADGAEFQITIRQTK